ncbi:MAG: Rpn family recombination-promoting nuclease/putative transposase [Albidovulum sp.]|nr:Rpn family recombination-promoting nuclease/putative transposase [Albidovulum sp.]
MNTTENPQNALFQMMFADERVISPFLDEFLPEALSSRLDRDVRPDRVEGTFVDEENEGSRSDALFRVQLLSGKSLLVYIIWERAFGTGFNSTMSVLTSMTRIWEVEVYGEAATSDLMPLIFPLVLCNSSSRESELPSNGNSVRDSRSERSGVRAQEFGKNAEAIVSICNEHLPEFQDLSVDGISNTRELQLALLHQFFYSREDLN